MSIGYFINVIVSFSGTDFSEDSKKARAKLVISSSLIVAIFAFKVNVREISLPIIKLKSLNHDLVLGILGCIALYALLHFTVRRIVDIKNERELSSKERTEEQLNNINKHGSPYAISGPTRMSGNSEEMDKELKKKDEIYKVHERESNRLIPIRLLALFSSMLIETGLPIMAGLAGLYLSWEHITSIYEKVNLIFA